MTDRGLPIVDGAPACPFVAFDDDRDGRSQAPDHRHRCFAEARPAPRALAHQEAYCLSSAFPVCPTFQDWARREAAATRTAESAEAAPPAPAVAPEPEPAPAVYRDPVEDGSGADDVPSMPPRRNPPRDWAAPPPWSGQEAAGQSAPDAGSMAGAAAAGLASSAAYRLAGPDPDEPMPATPVDGAAGASYEPDDAAQSRSAADRSDESSDGSPQEPDDAYGGDAMAGSYGSYERRSVGRSSRSGSSGSGSRPATSQARPAPSQREPDDPSEIFGPAWEHGRRYEAYPALRTRVGLPGFGGVPRLGLAAIGVLVAALALFFVGPMLLGIGSNDGGTGATTPAPSVDASLTPAPTIPAAPTPQLYVVVKGDTFSKIARRFGVTVEELQAANPQIKNINKIGIGDEITIPVPQASSVPNASEEITSAP